MIVQDLDSFGFPGYAITEDGLIWSYADNHWIPFYSNEDGSVRVVINKQFVTLHILVAKVFIPNPDNKKYVKHIDGDKDNNHFTNLKWVDRYEQLRKSNINDNRHILTEDEVHFICKCLQNGMGHTAINVKYGFPKHAIYEIKRGETWKHISSQYDIADTKKYNAKLTEPIVRSICELLRDGSSVSEVAKKLDVSYDVVRKINIGKNWRNISKEYFEITE